MRAINTLLILLLFSTISIGQKVKLKDYKVIANYLSLPSDPLPQDVVCYNVVVDCDNSFLKRYGVTSESLAKDIIIDGYEKVDIGGDVTVEAYVGNVTFGQWAAKTSTSKSGDKSVTKYYYEIPYQHEYGYTITDLNGNVLFDGVLSQSGQQKTHSTDKFDNSSKRSDWRKNSSDEMYSSVRKKAISANIDEMKKHLRSHVGYSKVDDKIEFESLSAKDHPDYSAWTKNTMALENAFGEMTCESNEAFVSAIQPVVDFWIEQEAKIDPSDKHGEKLLFATQMNLAKAYYWMEDLKNAEKYALRVENGDKGGRKGKKFLEDIARLQEKLENENVMSQHFKKEMTDEKLAQVEKAREEKAARDAEIAAERAEAIAAGEFWRLGEFEKRIKPLENSLQEKGTIYAEKVTDGVFVFEPKDSRNIPNLHEYEKIRFAYINEEDEVSSGKLNLYKIDSIRIGERTYHVGTIKVSDLKFDYCMFEIIKDFKKTEYIAVHRSNVETLPIIKTEMQLGNEGDKPTMVVYHRERDKFSMAESTLISSFATNISRAIKDCDELVEKVKATDYDTVNIGEAALEILAEYDNCASK